MIDKKRGARLYGVILAVTFGSVFASVVYHFWPGSPVLLKFLIFIVLCVWCYFAGVWALIERPDELNRKYPLSGKELRRRRQQFYDWLDSLGPH